MASPNTFSAALPFLSEGSSLAYAATHFLTQGGGTSIQIDEASGLNAFHVAAAPISDPSYASSFANSISVGAFASVQRLFADFDAPYDIAGRDYGTQLEKLRLRIRDSYSLPHSVDIVFAASSVELEYVALALGNRDNRSGLANIVLGLEDADTGCAQAAIGLYAADLTPNGQQVIPGAPVDTELAARIQLTSLPLRDLASDPIPSEDIMLSIASAVDLALREGRQPMVRVVHGSLTGLVAPSTSHLDSLRRRFGPAMSLIVDATQGRISRDNIAAYLSRGATVLLSGSKFMGGPPSSAFALVPAAARSGLIPLPAGFDTVFSRHEWPASWPGAERLPDLANLGLLTRLSAAIYELELYATLAPGELRRVVHQFDAAAKRLMRELAFGSVSVEHSRYTNEDQARPLEVQTSVMMDTSRRRLTEDHLAARGLHLQLINAKLRGSRPVRLGPPVKALKLPDGRFAGNLTLSLSMPQIVALAAMETGSIADQLDSDFQIITKRIRELT